MEEERPGDIPEEQAEAAPRKKREPAPVLVPVRVLGRKGGSALVEWVADGAPHRGYVPVEALGLEGAPLDVLDRAVPYGLAWETISLPGGEEVAGALAAELRRRGIWTAEDLARGQKAALGAVQAVARIHLGRLNEFSHK